MKSLFSLKLQSKFLKNFFSSKKEKRSSYLLNPKVISAIVVMIFLPVLLVCYSIHQKHQKLLQAKERLSALALKAKKTSLLRSRATFFTKQAELSDPAFLEKNIASLSLLKKEKEQLEEFFKNKEIAQSFFLQKREKEVEENFFAFEEVKREEEGNIEERVISLKKPVQLSEKDLMTLLNKIENPSVLYANARPQLFFKSFSLKKKNISPTYELFECDFSLVERKKITPEKLK